MRAAPTQRAVAAGAGVIPDPFPAATINELGRGAAQGRDAADCAPDGVSSLNSPPGAQPLPAGFSRRGGRGCAWTPADEQMALRMREAGATYQEIGAAISRSWSAVKDKFQQMAARGIPIPRRPPGPTPRSAARPKYARDGEPWTPEEISRALEMAEAGWTTGTIAGALQRGALAVAAALQKARRAVRPGHSPLRRDSSGWRQHLDTIRRMASEGCSDSEIAEHIGGGITAATVRHARRVSGIEAGRKYGGHARRKRALTLRTCLCCRKPFESEGIHNRLCSPCKSTSVFAA